MEEEWKYLGSRAYPTGKIASIGPMEEAIIAMIKKRGLSVCDTNMNQILKIQPHIPGDQEPEVTKWNLIDPNNVPFAQVYAGPQQWYYQKHTPVDAGWAKVESFSYDQTLTLGRDDLAIQGELGHCISKIHFTIGMERSDEGLRLVIADKNGTWVKKDSYLS